MSALVRRETTDPIDEEFTDDLDAAQVLPYTFSLEPLLSLANYDRRRHVSRDLAIRSCVLILLETPAATKFLSRFPLEPNSTSTLVSSLKTR